jgi:2-amino-4-hydroxy-6-hydroxymethyldihydropteridine diphosphokinase
MQKKTAYLGMGSNLGNKVGYIEKGIELIDRHLKMEVVQQSSFYRTVPLGYENQEKFINAVIEIQTILSPIQLLNELQKIEFELKRKRTIRWGPRTMDIDILLYDDINTKGTILTIPHPRMTLRQFVLIPLKEIAEDIEINGKHIDCYLDQLDDQGVRDISDGE